MSDNENEPKRRKSNNSGLIVLIIMIIVVLLLAAVQVFTSFSGVPDFPKHNHKKNAPLPGGKYVAELCIDGVIEKENEEYNQEWLLDTISNLKKDSNNLGLVLIIDSPGGSVYEADEAYLAIEDYRTEKPVWAYFKQLAASGGYYIGCGAEKIAANRNTLTGSIGVIAGVSLDMTKFMEEHGIKMTTFTAGKNKNMGGINNEITEEQAAIMQSLADECYEQFVGIVAKSRKMDVDKVKDLADGRIYTANQAKNNGLIDEVLSYEDFKKEITDSLGEKPKVTFTEFTYERDKKFYEDFFKLFSNAEPVTAEAKLFEKLTSSTFNYPAYIYF